MATSQGGLRIMAGAGAKKDPATEAVAVVPGGDVKEAVATSAEVAPATWRPPLSRRRRASARSASIM